MRTNLSFLGSVVSPVDADLAAEVASQSVHSTANVSQLLTGGETLNVSAVPQHPAPQGHQHKQSPCMQLKLVNLQRLYSKDCGTLKCLAKTFNLQKGKH